MKSEYFKVGAVVDITGTKSTRAEGNREILEVHPQGIVVKKRGDKNAAIQFFSWEKIEELKLYQGPALGVVTTAGGKK